MLHYVVDKSIQGHIKSVYFVATSEMTISLL